MIEIIKNPIVQIIAGIVGLIAVIFIEGKIVKWLQAYRTRRQQDESTDARSGAQDDNQRSNRESDRLREIENGKA